MRLISQLIKGILRVLLRYFNGTTVSTSFVLPAAGFFSVILVFDTNDLEFTIDATGSSLQLP